VQLISGCALCCAENSGNVEAQIRLHHENLLHRLEEDFQTVLRDLRSMRETEERRLQARVSDLETSKLELEGQAGRLMELVAHCTHSELIREKGGVKSVV